MSTVDTSTVYSVKTKTLTYMGRRCRVTTTKHQSRSTGLRTVEFLWLDDATEANGGHPAGTRVVEVMQGDGRPGYKPEHVLHSREIYPPKSATIQSLTIGELVKGDAGTIDEGKFEGRAFTVRAVGTSGRTVMVNWLDKGTTGVVHASTAVVVTR